MFNVAGLVSWSLLGTTGPDLSGDRLGSPHFVLPSQHISESSSRPALERSVVKLRKNGRADHC